MLTKIKGRRSRVGTPLWPSTLPSAAGGKRPSPALVAIECPRGTRPAAFPGTNLVAPIQTANTFLIFNVRCRGPAGKVSSCMLQHTTRFHPPARVHEHRRPRRISGAVVLVSRILLVGGVRKHRSARALVSPRIPRLSSRCPKRGELRDFRHSDELRPIGRSYAAPPATRIRPIC